MATAAILVVGDEILEGHTQDSNSHYLAKRLAARGLTLRRVVTCPDDVDEISRQLARLVEDGLDFVFTCGGIGPTPDDRTYEAVATAASLPLVLTPEDEAWLQENCRRRGYSVDLLGDPDQGEPLRRMVRRPEGSIAIHNPIGMALGSLVRIATTKVIVLPGVPRELQSMMEQEVEPKLLGAAARAIDVAEVEYVGAEARLYGLMRQIEARFPGVKIGSYPQDDRGRVILRLQGPADRLPEVLRVVADALPQSRRTR